MNMLTSGLMEHYKWFLSILIVLISITSGHSTDEGCVRPQKFDYLMLSVQNTVIEGSVEKPSSHSWTIHGLWPQITGRRDYGHCCAPHEHEFLDLKDLSSLESRLKEYWPSNRGSDFSFWVHEWRRHGTCAQLSVLAKKKIFFGSALKLYFRTNVDALFAKANIKYNGVYSAQTILSALEDEFGNQPTLHCKKDVGPNQAISEIRFCFDPKTGKRISCSNPIGSCFKTKQLFLAGKNFKPRSRM